MSATVAVDRVLEVLEREGQRRYDGEAVSQLAHALQCATMAERHGAPATLIAAALLHDLGHLLDGGDERAAARGLDRRHEVRGAAWLGRWFQPAAVEAVRLHVDAKRYLCWQDSDYFARLSPASVKSLQVQGGPFDDTGAAAFAATPHAMASVALRQWDEAAKDPAAETPDLAHFRPYLGQALKPGQD